ncbi:PilN domain-containing protein [Bacillota bacterium LX-D]|nr:PilN domain-containing protein [Bacillota bacterium LX-D]
MITKVKDINFLPDWYIQGKTKQKKMIVLAVVTILVLVMLLVPQLVLTWYLSMEQQRFNYLQHKYDQLGAAAAETKILQKEISRLEKKISQYREFGQQKRSWPDLLSELNLYVPDGVWFESLQLAADYKPIEEQKNQSAEDEQTMQSTLQNALTSENNVVPKGELEAVPSKVIIVGKSYSLEQIGKFVYQLSQSTYFSKVEVKNIIREKQTGISEVVILAEFKEGNVHEN